VSDQPNRTELRRTIRKTLDTADGPPRERLKAQVAAEGYGPDAVERELKELERAGFICVANDEVRRP